MCGGAGDAARLSSARAELSAGRPYGRRVSRHTLRVLSAFLHHGGVRLFPRHQRPGAGLVWFGCPCYSQKLRRNRIQHESTEEANETSEEPFWFRNLSS